MVENQKTTLTEYLRDLVEWKWSEFVMVENDESAYTSDQGAVIALIRAIANRKLPAIKEAVDRLDGRQAAVTEVVYPTFKMLYPKAKAKEIPNATVRVKGDKQIVTGEDGSEWVSRAPADPPAITEEKPMATGSIRDTILRMGKEPRVLVTAILASAEDVDENYRMTGVATTDKGDPKVKSVIAATLHDMARRGDLKAIFEVLDQIEGKIANKIEIKGEDVEMMNYALVAPENAVLNDDGIYEVVMPQLTSNWQIALDPDADNARRFGDGR